MELQEQDWKAEVAKEWGHTAMHPNYKDGEDYNKTLAAYDAKDWDKVVAMIVAYRMINS